MLNADNTQRPGVTYSESLNSELMVMVVIVMVMIRVVVMIMG